MIMPSIPKLFHSFFTDFVDKLGPLVSLLFPPGEKHPPGAEILQ
jgi:hypothetical protein